MMKKEKGFTLIEVLIAVLVFAIGILSMAALGALNYSYIRVNQEKARIHILTESAVDDIQQWAREEPDPPSTEPTRFDSLFNAGASNGDIVKIYTYSTCKTTIHFDNQVGTSSAAADAKIFLGITTTGTIGGRALEDYVYFCLSNYGVGD
jgi:prepilin-type N-terminal cleavage/methylation domain-containing protein